MTPNETVALSNCRIGVVIRQKNGNVHITIVDAQDYPLVSEFRWALSSKGYATHIRHAGPVRLRMHRVIMGAIPPGRVVDHIDRNPLNNVRANLRLATPGENQRNSKKPVTNTSGYKGVSWDSRNQKWRVSIQVSGTKRNLGRYSTKEEAHQAYCEAALWLHGDFANFGDD